MFAIFKPSNLNTYDMMQCKAKSENLAHILGYQFWAVTDYHLATAMDPRSKVGLLRNHPGGRHGDEEPSGIDLPSSRVLGTASESPLN